MFLLALSTNKKQKNISKFKRIQLPHSYRTSVQIFNLDIPTTKLN